jgi:hypothetical protein
MDLSGIDWGSSRPTPKRFDRIARHTLLCGLKDLAGLPRVGWGLRERRDTFWWNATGSVRSCARGEAIAFEVRSFPTPPSKERQRRAAKLGGPGDEVV